MDLYISKTSTINWSPSTLTVDLKEQFLLSSPPIFLSIIKSLKLNLHEMDILFYYFLILNIMAFVQIAYDKHLAKTQKQRISERSLLGFVFIGGTIGSGLAMLIFRHKTAKKSYLLKFWLIVIVQILITWLYLNQ